MAFQIDRKIVDFILLGPEDDRRQLQDSPILGDVWIEFAKQPGAQLDLLITPYKATPASKVATLLSERLGDSEKPKKVGKSGKRVKGVAAPETNANVAYLQGIVAAKLSFEKVLRYVVPMTKWWTDKKNAMSNVWEERDKLHDEVRRIFAAEAEWRESKDNAHTIQTIATHKRYITLAALILWASKSKSEGKVPAEELVTPAAQKSMIALLDKELHQLEEPEEPSLVWHVSLNRRASPALDRSVAAVKADSARSLFTVNCTDLIWAIIDSGLDATHPVFHDAQGTSRVCKVLDFTRIRDIVSLDNVSNARALARAQSLVKGNLLRPLTIPQVAATLSNLALDAKVGRSINWDKVEELIEITPSTPPPSHHGTHVAGILAANKNGRKGKNGTTLSNAADGMCPDIRIYDLRVLSSGLKETEFSIIGALQYIRHINERNSFMTIHGANLSMSIPHDVRNYACGRTPICNECERLVNSGVVVVAAAGNRGYQGFETEEGLYESYAAFSVTDPGNADGVITVGATHRYWPHTYGVSFFSSRGPTGDGRMKPDLVAPGERIEAALPNGDWGQLDGTSMAAPHVSGAAAMLMARYSELVGQPRRIKKILCDSATDLGRERSFQGYGMLDVLRALQSI